MNRINMIDVLASAMYISYAAANQGKSASGAALPSEENLFTNECNAQAAAGFKAAASTALEEFFPSSAWTDASIETELKHATFIDKSLRRTLGLAVKVLETQIKHGGGTSERTLAMRKIQEGSMWLGMDLGKIGDRAKEFGLDLNKYPYETSRDPKSPVIHSHANLDPHENPGTVLLDNPICEMELHLDMLVNNEKIDRQEGNIAEADRLLEKIAQTKKAIAILKAH